MCGGAGEESWVFSSLLFLSIPTITISLDGSRNDVSSHGLEQQLIERPALREWFLFNTIPSPSPLLHSFRSLKTLDIRNLSGGALVLPAMPALVNLHIGFDYCFLMRIGKTHGTVLLSWTFRGYRDFPNWPFLASTLVTWFSMGNQYL